MNRRLVGRGIRDAGHEDLERLLELWVVAGASPSVTDSRAALVALLELDPRALLVVDGAGGGLAGSLIAAWNGWRGSLYRLAVHPRERRRGLASLLVSEGERRLRERGALRIDAIVATDEAPALRFWSEVGYERQEDRARFVRDFGV
jgi:ribosomal protein S18 acetylase RimI-like enzyme